jgi:EmrB/QacA subfamily drug resistance transporter
MLAVTLPSSSRPTNPRLALIAISVVVAIMNIDITAVNVALVSLGKDLHARLGDLQWGLNTYMLAFAALIVTAGRLADVFGRRRCLLIGAALFAVASLLCGIAPTLSILIIGRLLQGAGGALMLPAGMAIISIVYGADQRAVALGTIVGVAGVAQSFGPLAGGIVTSMLSWRVVFLVNLPLVALVMIVATRSIQETNDETASRRIDIAGVVALAAALTTLLLGLDATNGGDANPAKVFGILALSVALFATFIIIERRTEAPIVDGKLLRQPVFLCSCIASGLLGFVFFLFLFISALYLQEELGYSALTAGVALVPFSLVIAISGVMSGRLARHMSMATILVVSCVLLAAGLAILSVVPASDGYGGMVLPFLLIAAGAGPGFTLLNTAGLGAAPAARSGQASGMIYMFRLGGGAVGVAAASALHGALFHRHLVFALSQASLKLPFAEQKLLERPGASEHITQFGSSLMPGQVDQVRQAFRDSFAAAFTGTLRLCVILPVIVALLILLLMRRTAPLSATSNPVADVS